MYRVYDTKKNIWLRDEFFLSPNNEMFIVKRRFLYKKIVPTSDSRFIVQMSTDAFDCKNNLIFEGDICRDNETNNIFVVGYAYQHCSYYLFDETEMKYYPLNEKTLEHIEVVGNVLENTNMLK